MVIRIKSTSIVMWMFISWGSLCAASVVPKQNEMMDTSAFGTATTTSYRVHGIFGGNNPLSSASLKEIPTAGEKGDVAPLEDEPWRKNKDWWKDPLSMFDENDEYIDPAVEAEKQRQRKEAEEKAATEKEALEQKKERSTAKNEATTELRKLKNNNEVLEKQQPQKEQIARSEAIGTKTNKGMVDAAKSRAEELKLKKAALEKAKAERDAKEKEAKELRSAMMKAEQHKRELETLKKEQEKMLEKQEQDEKRQRKVEEEEARALVSVSSTRQKPSIALAGIPVPNVSKVAKALPPGISIASLMQLASSFPVLKVFATFTLGKILMEKWVQRKQHGSDVTKSEEEEYDDLEFENIPFRQEPLQYNEPVQYTDEVLDQSEEDLEVDQPDHDATAPLKRQPPSNIPLVPRAEKHFPRSPSSSSNPFLNGLRSMVGGGKVTYEELEQMKVYAEKALAEKHALEQEYEKTSFQLQELLSEVSQLTATTKYLKSQLREYEDMMDRTIRNERKKAKVELRRMKEVMEATREKDRAALRRQFTKELERMQYQYEQQFENREDSDNSTKKAIK